MNRVFNLSAVWLHSIDDQWGAYATWPAQLTWPVFISIHFLNNFHTFYEKSVWFFCSKNCMFTVEEIDNVNWIFKFSCGDGCLIILKYFLTLWCAMESDLKALVFRHILLWWKLSITSRQATSNLNLYVFMKNFITFIF